MTSEERTNIFGIPYQPPERDEAVAQYQRRSMHKLHIAEWHHAQFVRLEGELTTSDFFDFDTERFLPAQAHADGALIQLSAGFDAFACAVAHHHELANPDRASFWGDKRVADLLDAAEPDLRERIQSVVGEENYAGLKFYRNLAAHRGVMGEQQRGGAVEEVGVDGVRFMLPDWLPLEAPDHPSFSIRPILDRYLAWGRPALAGLNALASVVWEPGDEAEAELVLVDEMFEDPVPPGKVDREPPDPVLGPTREDLAPRVGDWRVWFEWGSHDFGNDSTVPPAWYARHDDDDPEVLNAVDLEIDRLREWLEGLTTQLATKAILWHYRPQQSPTNVGRVLAPRIRR